MPISLALSPLNPNVRVKSRDFDEFNIHRIAKQGPAAQKAVCKTSRERKPHVDILVGSGIIPSGSKSSAVDSSIGKLHTLPENKNKIKFLDIVTS